MEHFTKQTRKTKNQEFFFIFSSKKYFLIQFLFINVQPWANIIKHTAFNDDCNQNGATKYKDISRTL